jgi:hypothetical protein
MLAEQPDRVGVDRQPAHLMALRVLLPSPDIVPPDCNDAGIEVEVALSKRIRLPAAGAGHDRQPHVETPLRVLPSGLLDQACRLRRGWRGLGFGLLGWRTASIGLNGIRPYRETLAELRGLEPLTPTLPALSTCPIGFPWMLG